MAGKLLTKRRQRVIDFLRKQYSGVGWQYEPGGPYHTWKGWDWGYEWEARLESYIVDAELGIYGTRLRVEKWKRQVVMSEAHDLGYPNHGD